ncbi:MAG TPA: hypothetical protein VFK05_31310 [Polyangiaceae bacterium]|nr:hypothetical protein [Polyangiaceae bacterium]
MTYWRAFRTQFASFGLLLGTSFAALTLSGCSAPEHPDFISSVADGGRRSIGPDASSNPTGDAGDSNTPEPQPAGDPSTVYLLVPLLVVYTPFALAPIDQPEVYKFGLCEFCGDAQFRGTDLLYYNNSVVGGAPLHSFVPDSTSPAPTDTSFPRSVANDPIVPTPGCENVTGFLTGPDRQLFYRCGDSDGAWWSGDVEEYHGGASFLAIGTGGVILVSEAGKYGILDLSTRKVTPVVGLPSGVTQFGIHWTADSFHIVLMDIITHDATLYEIHPDGSSVMLGTYDFSSPLGAPLWGELAADDTFVTVDYTDTSKTKVAINRLGPDGSVKEAFSSKLPHATLHLEAARLITGR